jgi:DegV family protein with EDD domain
MPAVKIITDSTAYIPQSYVDQYGLEVVPLTVNWDGKSYLDGVDIKAAEFYTRLKDATTLPTTNAISIHQFEELFKKLTDAGNSVLVLPISSGISASHNNAITALEHFKDKSVAVLDTRLVSMALTFMVLAAARKAESGASLEEVKAEAIKAYDHIGVYFTVDDLKYLHKGGRIGGAKRLLGSALKIKPILEIRNGKIEAAGSAVTRKKALERIVNLVEDGIAGRSPVRISVFHALDLETAQQLEAICKERFSPVEMISSEVSPVVGSHVGPGTVSIAYMAGM